MVTKNTKIPFGRTNKGRKLCDCPTDYLRWVARNLWDTDYHQYAVVASDLVESRVAEEAVAADLEQAADEFLREHGIDPKKL